MAFENEAELINSLLETRNSVIGFKTSEEKKQEEEIKKSVDYQNFQNSVSDSKPSKEERPLEETKRKNLDYLANRNIFLSYQSRQEIIQNALQIVRDRLKCQAAVIYLFSKDGLLERVGIQGIDKDGKLIENDWFKDEKYEIGESFTGKAAKPKQGSKYGETQLTNNLLDESLSERGKKEHLDKLGELKSGIAVPLNGRNKTYGVLKVINKENQESDSGFSKEDSAELSLLAGNIATALSNFRIDLQNEIFRHLSILLANPARYNFNYSNIYQQIGDLLTGPETAFKACILRIKNDETGVLEVAARSTVPTLSEMTPEKGNGSRKIGEGFAGLAAQYFRPQIVEEISESNLIDKFINQKWIEENKLESFGCFPLIVHEKEEVVGTLSLYAGYKYNFHPSTIDFLQRVTTLIAAFLENAKQLKMLFECRNQLKIKDSNTSVFAPITDNDEERVIEAIANPKWDFRTVEGISQETGIPETKVKEILNKNQKRVRKAFVLNRQGRELFTRRSKSIKLKEYLALARVLLVKSFH